MIPPLLALFSYPFVALALFSQLHLRAAIIWVLVLGYLFLPPKFGYNLPVLPTLGKDSMPAISVLLCLAIFATARVRPAPRPGLLPRHPLILGLVGLVIFCGFPTVLTNSDRQVFGPTVLPGLRLYDGFSSAQGTIMTLLPLLIARKYLADAESHKLLLKILALAGAIYSLLVVFELIMSPQLNTIIYGYFQHSWRQHVRGGGYRPLVFLQHGLWLGIFMCCAVLATFAYLRSADPGRRTLYFLLGGWLLVILGACKAFGAWGIAIMLVPVILFFGVRLQLIVAACVASTLLFYPVLRGGGWIPVYQFADQIARIDPARASSLRYRLYNEDMLLARANERPFFGWGGYSRARVFDEFGQDQSTTDGYWVIRIGEKGWAGYVGEVGLLTAPILLLALRRRWQQQVSLATSGLCVVLAANLVDLIPNATLTSVTWLVAGALVGRLEHQGAEEEDADPVPARRGPPGYSRFGPTSTPVAPSRTARTGATADKRASPAGKRSHAS